MLTGNYQWLRRSHEVLQLDEKVHEVLHSTFMLVCIPSHILLHCLNYYDCHATVNNTCILIISLLSSTLRSCCRHVLEDNDHRSSKASGRRKEGLTLTSVDKAYLIESKLCNIIKERTTLALFTAPYHHYYHLHRSILRP